MVAAGSMLDVIVDAMAGDPRSLATVLAFVVAGVVLTHWPWLVGREDAAG